MPADISRSNNENVNRRTNTTRIHRCVITRVVEDGLYEFVIPEFDTNVRFGPSPGNLGLIPDDEPFAIPTVDAEWFLILPQMLGAGGGGGGITEETDPVVGPLLTAHIADTTDVHGIADTTVLATDAEVTTAANAALAAANAALALHAADTTAIHGIADTANLVLTSDARLSDTRTPSDNSVTSAKIVDGAIVNTDINAAAAIAYSKLALAGSIVNADIAAGAAIAKTKLAALAIVNADVAAAAGITYSKLSLGNSIVNSDIAAAAAIAKTKLGALGIVDADVTGPIAANKIAGTALTLGGGTLTGGLYLPLGTLSGTALGFSGDPNTGLYSSGADSVSLVTGGIDRLAANMTGVTMAGQIVSAHTTSAASTIQFFLVNAATSAARPTDLLMAAYSGWGTLNDLKFTINNSGAVRADGTFTGGGADYAEWFEHDAPMSVGDVVGLNVDTGKVRKYQKGDPVVGVVSETPAFAAGDPTPQGPPQPGVPPPPPITSTHSLIGLIGQVYVDPAQYIVDKRSVLTTTDKKRIGFRLANGKVFISALGIVSLPGAA